MVHLVHRRWRRKFIISGPLRASWERSCVVNHFPDPDILTNKNRMDERYKLGEEILPQSIMMETSKVYADVAEKITGEKIVSEITPAM